MAVRPLVFKLLADTGEAQRDVLAVRKEVQGLTDRRNEVKLELFDTNALLKLRAFDVKLDKLSERVAEPTVSVKGVERSIIEVATLDAMLERLKSKTVDVNVDRGFGGSAAKGLGYAFNLIKGFFPGQTGPGLSGLTSLLSGGGATGAAGGLLGVLAGGGTALGTSAAVLAAVAPLLGAVGSAGVAGAGGGLLGLYGLQHALTQSPFLTKRQNESRADVSGQFTHLGTTFNAGILRDAQTFVKPLGSIANVLGGDVMPVLHAIGLAFKAMAPGIEAFGRSLAFALGNPQVQRAVVEMGKAFGALLKAFAPQLPGIINTIATGFKDVADAIVGHPQMLKVMAAMLSFFLKLPGYGLEAMAKLARVFGWLVTTVPPIFDHIRHYIAASWDATYRDSIGKVVQIDRDVFRVFSEMWHAVSNSASAGVRDIINWFVRLWSGIWDQVRHWPQWLWNVGKDALNLFWNGFKSVGGAVVHWFDGLGHSILGALKSVFGIHSPSRAMFEIGVNLGHGLIHGLNSTMPHMSGSITALGTSVTGWIQQALRITHEPMSWLAPLMRLVSLESGGNPYAYNPISVGGQHATGLFQTLPSTFAEYSLGGSITNPVADAIAGIRYLASRYGSPWNIPGLFNGQYQGYARGGWITEPIAGMGLSTGRLYSFGERGSEYVSPHGAGSGMTLVLNFNGLTAGHPREIGRQVVHYIREFEKGGGKGWRAGQ